MIRIHDNVAHRWLYRKRIVPTQALLLALASTSTARADTRRVVTCPSLGIEGIQSLEIFRSDAALGAGAFQVELTDLDGGHLSLPLDQDPNLGGQYVFTHRQVRQWLFFEPVTGQWCLQSGEGSSARAFLGLSCY